MQLNKILKGLAITLPLMTLAACSSNDKKFEDQSSEMNNGAEVTDGSDSGVDTDAISPMDMSFEEKLAAKYGQAILENTISFAYDQSEIAPEYRVVLNAHAQYLVESQKSVTIEGHTDERGTPEYNIALGERRALSVVRYLQSMGVPATQLSTVSYGEEKPANFSHSDAAYAENRRAVLIY
ncbi:MULTISPECIES: peptidoglycan-associated lipoprotein Pal [unclassified Motilimonas]|uniref:peptidoglycan-associated lipoprotein Pal n=1 Tax=Motilimonas TaxID=1914248 RepID=UPI001E359E92|nr:MULTISPECIES: peptidoglycan-associated lipoprotein Pal [unclassified Motilimonas]MCE0556123.1 peptidoglycan-associated lipoprotein Pal [Motilimonas sp. E26]MDO6527583.1 peptidoglycan-associated lipoprotein Pal [Motilimonas sp. 1_MG-2023]